MNRRLFFTALLCGIAHRRAKALRLTGNAVGATQYCAAGDSITAVNPGYDPGGSYAALFAQRSAFRPAYVNGAINGTKITDFNYTGMIGNNVSYGAAPRFSGQIVSIFFGTNDSIAATQTPTQFLASLNAVILAFQLAGACVIVCTSMNSYPSSPITNSFGVTLTTCTWCKDANALIRSSGVQNTIADFEAISAMNGNNYMNATHYATLGNVHPNDAGQELMYGVFEPTATSIFSAF